MHSNYCCYEGPKLAACLHLQIVRPKEHVFTGKPKIQHCKVWRCPVSTLFLFSLSPLLCHGKVGRTGTPIVPHLGLLLIVDDSVSRFTVSLLIKGLKSIHHV